MGHVARLLEGAGIATVIIASVPFKTRLEAMAVPRLVATPHLMGRPLGIPGDAAEQRRILETALQLLASVK